MTENSKAKNLWRRWKPVAMAAAALVLVILILQNTQPVETHLLVMKVTMSRAVLLIVTLLIGFALGLVAASLWNRRKKGDAEPPSSDGGGAVS